MSGIVGIWNRDGEPLEPSWLARCSATLAHRGVDGEERWIRGPVGLACQLLRVTPESAGERQPALDAAGAALVFDGRLDNREEILAALPATAPVTTASPDPVLVLAAYRAFGETFGSEAVAGFDAAVGDGERVVEIGGVGEIAHAELVEPIVRAGPFLAEDDDVDGELLRVHASILASLDLSKRREATV